MNSDSTARPRPDPVRLPGSAEAPEATANLENIKCVLLADRHHGLTEGIHRLLETTFDAVVMVADEPSLQESAARLQPSVAVVDLSLARGESLDWLQRLRARCSDLKVIVLSVHDEPSVCRSVMQAGANGFVLKRALAAELMSAVDAVLAGHHYVSSGISQSIKPGESRLPKNPPNQKT